jgi:hypothetical protein
MNGPPKTYFDQMLADAAANTPRIPPRANELPPPVTTTTTVTRPST